MGLFGGVEKAQVSKGGVYVLPGAFIVAIDSIKHVLSRKKEDLYCVEMVVLDSNNDERPEGSKMSWMVNFKHDSALGNIKEFLAVVKGESEDDITEDDCEESWSEENPYAGTALRLNAANVKTKSGGDFTKCSWSEVTEEDLEALDAA